MVELFTCHRYFSVDWVNLNTRYRYCCYESAYRQVERSALVSMPNVLSVKWQCVISTYHCLAFV